jgi:hypothetical protein
MGADFQFQDKPRRQVKRKLFQFRFRSIRGCVQFRFFLFPAILGGIMLFFIDFNHRPGSAVYQLYGFAHLFFFALMARELAGLASLMKRPFFLQVILIMCVILGVGGIIELIQPYFGSSASWGDLGLDFTGGFLGIVFFSPVRRSLARRILVCGQCAALALVVIVSFVPITTIWDMWVATRQFPVLGDFESRLEITRWSNGEIDNDIARHGQCSLRVFLGTERYAGTTLKRSFGDWSGYSTLAFSIYNPDPGMLVLSVSIRDHEHFRRGGEYGDRFNSTFRIEQGWNDVHIPIAQIENAPSARRLELDRLSEIVIFAVDLPKPRLFYLDYVRLIQ